MPENGATILRRQGLRIIFFWNRFAQSQSASSWILIRSFAMEDKLFMQHAIELALLAEQEGNLPVGAVIVLNGNVVAEGRSVIWVPKFDATRHAEMEALRAVPQDLWGSSGEMRLYTTLEPCLMCFGSILLHGIGTVVFGSIDKYGGASSILTHLPPFFHERFEDAQWLGPIMPGECDPLHARLLAMEGEGRGLV
jgi:tRNA(adenine34) deaminase